METDKIYKKNIGFYQKQINKCRAFSAAAKAQNPDTENVINFVGCYVLGPALFMFTRFLILSAKKDNVQRIYFLARDGFLPYKAAKIIQSHYHINLDIRYLSLSRLSLNGALLFTDKDYCFDYLFLSTKGLTSLGVLKRAGLTENEAKNFFYSLKTGFDISAPLTKPQKSKLKHALYTNAGFYELVKARSRGRFDLLIQYLKQEGLMDNTPFAIADSGWAGTTQYSLKLALDKAGARPRFYGYYWGLYRYKAAFEQKYARCFYFYPCNGFFTKLYFNNNLIEAAFAAPHGTTIGYVKSGQSIQPLYSHEKLDLKLGAALEFVKSALANTNKKEFFCGNTKTELKILKSLLKRLMYRPSPTEAKKVGSLYFTDDMFENKNKLDDMFENKNTLEYMIENKNTLEDMSENKNTLEDMSENKNTLEDMLDTKNTLEDMFDTKNTLLNKGWPRANIMLGKSGQPCFFIYNCLRHVKGTFLALKDRWVFKLESKT